MKTDVQPQRQIVVDARTRAYLSRLMGVSERTVYNALGKDGGRSELQRRIRKAAIENGGMPTVTVSEDDAIFITGTDGARSMVRHFRNGATMECSLTTGYVEVRNRQGELAGAWNNPKVTELKALERMAQTL